MTTDDTQLSRRGFLRAAGTSAAVAGGAAGSAVAAEGGGGSKPNFGGWLEGVDGGFTDARGQSEVTVTVGAQGNGGAYAFSPAGLWVDPGTTVKWEWTGDGGAHNVHAVEGASFESDLYTESGVHFEHTFESGGIVDYQCDPHVSMGMKGAVAVGDDVPTGGGGGYVSILPDSAKIVGIAGTAVMTLALGFSYVFMRFGGDFGADADFEGGEE